MSKYAYTDINKTKIIMAEDCVASDIKKDFYCTYPDCTSIVHLCAFNSNKVKPYFKGNNHDSKCCFYKHLYHSDISNFDVTDFTPNNLLSLIQVSQTKSSTIKESQFTQRNNSVAKKHIHSIKSLYYLSINYPLEYKINGFKIKNLICNLRTGYIYFKYIKGVKLVVCKYHRYDTMNKAIYFRYYHSNIDYLPLKILFEDNNLFQKVKKQLYGFEGDVLIYADWSNNGKYMESKIVSYRQITVIK